MQLPKLKINKLSSDTTLNLTLSSVVLFVLLLETYLAYQFLYKNLMTPPIIGDTDKIVRVDVTSYRSTIKLLDDMEVFAPNNPVPLNTEPFK